MDIFKVDNSIMEILPNDAQFRLIELPDFLLTPALYASFGHLPKDKYMKPGDDYRYRAFVQGAYNSGGITWEESTQFNQPKALNSYMGDVERRFEPVSVTILGNLAELASYLLGAEPNSLGELKVGCHQIRIKVSEDMVGKPAPEGFHQDGFDYICLVCVNAENICGGLTVLRTVSEIENHEVASLVLESNQALLINDKVLEHYTTPISHRIPGDGYRDVLVFTFKKLRHK